MSDAQETTINKGAGGEPVAGEAPQNGAAPEDDPNAGDDNSEKTVFETIAKSTRTLEPVVEAAVTAGPVAAPADADRGNWVDRFAPDFAKPYLRLIRADRPIGTWLLLIPCWWGLALAAAEFGVRPPMSWLGIVGFGVLFAVGAFVMRGAGCAYNDIVDRDIDAKVDRTALRPIPSGQITVGAAAAFMAVLCLVGLAVLTQFNRQTILLGLASIALVAAYPFAKRITYWPQAWLGLTFNWGALLGYAAIAGALSWPAFILYAAGVSWTIAYDTIYAHQDKEDDALIGVKSTALRFGDQTQRWLIGFFAGTIALFALAGIFSGFTPLYFLALGLPAAHFFLQLKQLNTEDSALCLEIFKSNRNAGLLLLAPLLLEAIIFAPYFGV